MTKHRYCSTCGKRLRQLKISANHYKSEYGLHPYTAYNVQSGKPQWVYHYICPKFINNLKTKLFGSMHDNWIDDNLIKGEIK